MSLEATAELRNKSTDHRRVGPSHVGNCQDQAFRVLFRRLCYFVGPIIGLVPVDPVGGDPRRNPPEVLDQCQTEHDGDCP